MAFKTIYLDMDGTLADFDKSVETSINWKYLLNVSKQTKYYIIRSFIYANPCFYEKELPLSHAKKLYELCKELSDDVRILTSYDIPKKNIDRFEMVKKYKRNWIHKYIDADISDDKILIVPSGKKYKYADKNVLLIDDRTDNVAQWKRRGGEAIHFTKWKYVKSILKKNLEH